MRELYIEGVAIHGGGEALTGYVQAGLLSRERIGFGVPTLSPG